VADLFSPTFSGVGGAHFDFAGGRGPLAELVLKNIGFSYNGRQVLEGITIFIPQGTLLGLIGPNGAGKTTLLKIAARLLRPETGKVFLGGRDVWRLPQREVARQLAVVPQEDQLGFPFSVAEVVMMGRYPHLRRLQREGQTDFAVVRRAMEATATMDLARRPVTTLSGGERRRVAIARALAQEPKVLLLDEPTAHLDIAHQSQMFRLLRRLSAEQGITVIAALHDLNLAAAFMERLVLLSGGRVVADGPPESVLTAQNVETAYGVSVRVTRHPDLGCPQLTIF